jgi:hypothetical protein
MSNLNTLQKDITKELLSLYTQAQVVTEQLTQNDYPSKKLVDKSNKIDEDFYSLLQKIDTLLG